MSTAIILGGGPSLKNQFNQAFWNTLSSSGVDIIALNRIYTFMPFAPHKILWIDNTFRNVHINTMKRLANTELHTISTKINVEQKVDQVTIHQATQELNIDVKDKVFIGTKRLTGIFAISLLIKLGYKKIYLLGYDYTNKYFTSSDKSFQIFNNYSIEIINVGLESEIECFNRINYQEFYKQLKGI